MRPPITAPLSFFNCRCNITRRLIHSSNDTWRRVYSQKPFSSLSRRHYAVSAVVPESSLRPSDCPVSSASAVRPISGAYHLHDVLEQIHRLLVEDFGGNGKWLKSVRTAQEDLTLERRGTVGVFGERLASPKDIVSSLLQDPMVDTNESRTALLQRHVDTHTDVLDIRQGAETRRDISELRLPSSWLRKSKFDIREIDTIDHTKIVDLLLQSDIALIVLDPYHLLASPLLSSIISDLAETGSLFLVVNGPLPPSMSLESLRKEIERQLSKLVPHSEPVPILFVQAEKALRALESLTIGISSDTSPLSRGVAFENFQQNFLASHMGELQTALLAVTSIEDSPQIRTATYVAKLALRHLEALVIEDRDANRTATHVIQHLRQDAERTGSKAKHLSVIGKGIEGGLVEGGVQHSLAKAQSDLEQLFNSRWSWLTLLARIRADEIGPELRTYLDRHFGRDLERNLIFETGQLAQIQSSLSKSADSVLQELAARQHHTASPLASPILVNHLSTLSLSVPPLNPSSLISPITSRRRQLLWNSVSRIQSAAQRSVWITLAVGASGITASWLAYIPPLGIVSAPTATAIALFGTVVGLSAGQRLWAAAQRRFWSDWRRITSMLRGDLQSNLLDIIDSQLSAKSLAAADGLDKIVRRRDARLNNLQRIINNIREKI